ncbi:MAG TPA: phosphopantothenate/pantothenate synthetase [Thermoplasmata archaeon]|nr:phosphopantothenate/pantothenate synthetase [Thermoplasmata archaeon]
MTKVSPQHPRYRSLLVRAALADAHRSGLVVPEGLIAQGRGEAFDYFLGERTIPSARRAERAAADRLLRARHPVVSVNGNVAALAAPAVADLARAVPGLRVEVNLFHRTARRARAVAARLREAGVKDVLGVRPTATLPGLASDRGWIDRRGIGAADVCLVPLEDGDRAEALRRQGLFVIAIDLNPLSRTARTADLPIIDELSRALAGIAGAARALRRRADRPSLPLPDGAVLRADALRRMRARLARAAGSSGGPSRARASRRPARGTARPRRPQRAASRRGR